MHGFPRAFESRVHTRRNLYCYQLLSYTKHKIAVQYTLIIPSGRYNITQVGTQEALCDCPPYFGISNSDPVRASRHILPSTAPLQTLQYHSVFVPSTKTCICRTGTALIKYIIIYPPRSGSFALRRLFFFHNYYFIGTRQTILPTRSDFTVFVVPTK